MSSPIGLGHARRDVAIARELGALVPDLEIEWLAQDPAFSGGYVLGREPGRETGRKRLRERLGYRADETVCVATVGGSAVGAGLLARLVGAFPAARERVPGLRMIAVAGPRIDQNLHVGHRLDRYRAGRCMDSDDATPERIADALASLLAEPVASLPLEKGAAARTAALIAELL